VWQQEVEAAQPPLIPHLITTDPVGDDPSWLSWEKAAH
jgi:hypothetical protein